MGKNKTKQGSKTDTQAAVSGDGDTPSLTSNGFVMLPILFRTPKQKEKADIVPKHVLYFKEHVVRSESRFPKGRTLFVLNPPLDAEHSLKDLFAEVGNVEQVVLSTQKGSHKSTYKDGKGPLVAHVVFRGPKQMSKALAMTYSPDRVLKLTSDFGMKKWMAAYEAARPDPAALQRQVDAAVAAFDDEEARRKAQEMSQPTDEDGWTIVRGATAEAEPSEQPIPKKPKKKELLNFYRFQKLEAHKEKLAQLRRRFDEDKARMQHLRSSRKFRPY